MLARHVASRANPATVRLEIATRQEEVSSWGAGAGGRVVVACGSTPCVWGVLVVSVELLVVVTMARQGCMGAAPLQLEALWVVKLLVTYQSWAQVLATMVETMVGMIQRKVLNRTTFCKHTQQ